MLSYKSASFSPLILFIPEGKEKKGLIWSHPQRSSGPGSFNQVPNKHPQDCIFNFERKFKIFKESFKHSNKTQALNFALLYVI